MLVSCHGIGVKREGRWLFRNLSLEVREKEILAIVGPSGTGKTTLLRCMSGHLPPCQGQVQSAIKAAVVPQHLQLCRFLSANVNAAAGRLGKHAWWKTLFGPPRSDLNAAAELLRILGLGKAIAQPVHSLSGGEQRRVAVARAILHGSPLIIADEPSSMLDQETGRAVLTLLRDTIVQRQGSLICVLHDESLAASFATRTVRLGLPSENGWITS